ncbi:hypothetical protein D3C72_2387520 [compost metagenome]
MSALVIGKASVAARELPDHGVPDARIGAQRIDENQCRRALGSVQPVVQQCAVDAGKIHGVLSGRFKGLARGL